MISQYFPILWSIVAFHIIGGIVVVFTKVKPKIDSGEVPSVDSDGFSKIFAMFELHAASYSNLHKKPWDYYYARAFKFLHLAAIAIIAITIGDVLMNKM